MSIQKKEIDQFEAIIGFIPDRTLRYYGIVILALLTLIGMAIGFLRIADKLSTDITITSLNPPISINASSAGIVKEIFVKDKTLVKKRQTLAHIEAAIDLDDIELIEKNIAFFASFRSKPEAVLYRIENIGHLEGELEIPVANLGQYLRKYIEIIQDPLYAEKHKILESQLVFKQNLQALLFAEYNNKKEELDMEDSRFEINRKLYDSAIISKMDYLQSKKQRVNMESILKRQETDIERNKSEMEEIRANIQTISIDYKKERRLIEDKIDEEIKGLKTVTHGMEHSYKLEASAAGLLEYVDVMDEGQNIRQEDVLFVITPEENQVIGRMAVPEINTANLKIGRIVRVKLQKYPFKDWGMLEGRIYAITNIPIEGKYRVKVEFPKGFLTTYGKRISEANQLEGKAEIILSKKTIFYHMFNQFNSTLDQMKD